jgi:hypothetical protein
MTLVSNSSNSQKGGVPGAGVKMEGEELERLVKGYLATVD